MCKLRKWVGLLLLSCLLLGILPAAQAATYAGLAFDTSYSGSEWTVTVKLIGNKRPQLIEFCLEYDSSKLKLKSVEAGSAFSSANAPTFSTPKAGRVLFAWEALTGLKDGKLLVLRFTAKSGAKGTADIFFNEDYNTVFMNGDRDDITVTLYRTEIDLDERSSSSSSSSKQNNDDWDDDDWDDDDDDWDDPYNWATAVPVITSEPWDTPAPWTTPAPWATPEPEETPAPAENNGYTMQDMVIYTGQVCTTQEGFLFLSSDQNVVTIENGQLRGVNAGIATVTAYKDGAAVGSCTITVQKDPAQKTAPAKGGTDILKVVLWAGIALILIAVIWIGIILIRRRY